MIKIPKHIIIEKIKEKAGLSDQEINSRVKDKLDQLSGLISEEGALHIIANELGVKILEDPGKLQIKNVLAGMRHVELTGKVMNIYEVRTFEKDNRKGRVGSFIIGDETGMIRVVAWNDKADLLSKIKENDIIKIENGYSRDNRGRMEVHLGEKTTVTISPNDVKDIEVKDKAERKKIADLKENENNVEILGTIVQVFDPRFFEVCPQCNKRVKKREDGFYCDVHNKVDPSYAYVLNLFLDDGTENVRVVLWRNQVQNLLNMNNEEIIAKKESSFEDIKNELLGQIVKFVGRTNKNDMFDRIEFIPQLVFTNPDPKEEIARLDKELESVKEESVKENKVETVQVKSDNIVEETQPSKESSTSEIIKEEAVEEPVEETIMLEKTREEPSKEDFMPSPINDAIEEKPEETLETVEQVKENKESEAVDLSETLIKEIETPEEPEESKPQKELEDIDDIEDITDLDSIY